VNKAFSAEESDRLDKVLNRVLSQSRNRIQKWIKQGRVRVDDEIITTKSKPVSQGQRINVEVPEEARGEGLIPEDKPINVIGRDEQILAIEKPGGMIVHPTESIQKGTLANRLAFHYPELTSVGESHRAGLVHRLDRGTSGVLLVARTSEAYKSLKKQFRERTVTKRYRAILSGHLEDDSLRIEVPIGYNSRNRMLRRADPTGQYAETRMDRVRAGTEATTVWCTPVTGRTHQLRVHAQYIGHPVVGDRKYGGDVASRLMLHSEYIEVDHPGTGDRISFEAEPGREVQELWENI